MSAGIRKDKLGGKLSGGKEMTDGPINYWFLHSQNLKKLLQQYKLGIRGFSPKRKKGNKATFLGIKEFLLENNDFGDYERS